MSSSLLIWTLETLWNLRKLMKKAADFGIKTPHFDEKSVEL